MNIKKKQKHLSSKVLSFVPHGQPLSCLGQLMMDCPLPMLADVQR
ncbi:hypothetical protein [Geminicoccus roseus]|nr:hypothetical protein [Geminicoccus roseus]